MKRIHNIEAFAKYGAKDKIIFAGTEGVDELISGEIDVVTVGPCVVRLFVAGVDDKTAREYLLGTVEGADTVAFAVNGEAAHIKFEPSGEVWYRQSKLFAALDNPEPDVTYTRMEKPGLYNDEWSMMAHRMAVMEKLRAATDHREPDEHTASLERRMAEMAETIEALKAEREAAEAVQVDNGAAQ